MSGPSSSGKSTLLKKCKAFYSSKFEYVEEITRKIKDKGIPINEEGSDLTQLLVINSHIENSLLNEAILDRCILDGLVYTRYLYNHNKVSQEVLDYAKFVYKMLHDKYAVIFYTLPVNLEDDGVRSNSQEFRNETIDIFKYIIESDPIIAKKIVYLSGTVEERFEIIRTTLSGLTK